MFANPNPFSLFGQRQEQIPTEVYPPEPEGFLWKNHWFSEKSDTLDIQFKNNFASSNSSYALHFKQSENDSSLTQPSQTIKDDSLTYVDTQPQQLGMEIQTITLKPKQIYRFLPIDKLLVQTRKANNMPKFVLKRLQSTIDSFEQQHRQWLMSIFHELFQSQNQPNVGIEELLEIFGHSNSFNEQNWKNLNRRILQSDLALNKGAAVLVNKSIKGPLNKASYLYQLKIYQWRLNRVDWLQRVQ